MKCKQPAAFPEAGSRVTCFADQKGLRVVRQDGDQAVNHTAASSWGVSDTNIMMLLRVLLSVRILD